MKQIAVILAIFLSFGMSTGCINSVPDNKIHAVKGEKGNWVYDSATHKNIQQIDSFYLLQPTWSQAIDYASKRADNKYYVIAGVVFLIAFLVAGIGVYKSAAWLPNWGPFKSYGVMFLLLAGSVTFISGNAYGIRWNNDKWVKKEVYDDAIKNFGSTKPIWDSLEVNHLIVDGPYIKK